MCERQTFKNTAEQQYRARLGQDHKSVAVRSFQYVFRGWFLIVGLFPVIDIVLSSFLASKAWRHQRLTKSMAMGTSDECRLIVVPDVFISPAHHFHEFEPGYG